MMTNLKIAITVIMHNFLKMVVSSYKKYIKRKLTSLHTRGEEAIQFKDEVMARRF